MRINFRRQTASIRDMCIVRGAGNPILKTVHLDEWIERDAVNMITAIRAFWRVSGERTSIADVLTSVLWTTAKGIRGTLGYPPQLSATMQG